MEHAKQYIIETAAGLFHEIREIRRHFHRHPELSCEEYGTAAFISRKLEEYGIPHVTGIAGTGIAGLIRGKDPESRCVGLRADMDALPVEEISTSDYRSLHPGKMHACGHDVHMACLLGAAKILTGLREQFSGTVKLIFQPSEETYPGGAIQMIEAGILENPAPEVIIAQHVINNMEAGDIGFRPGAYMASTDEFFITVKGKGGHAATPAQVIDPILIASHIVVALQQIVSRNADPVIPSVVSIGKIIGEGRTNILPDEVKMEGTVRTYNESWRKEIHRKIKKIATAIAEGMGAACEVRIAHGYPALVNDPGVTSQLQRWAEDYLGKDHVRQLEPRMTAEDFSYFAQRLPACLYRLGITSASAGINSNLHTNTFDVDEQSLITGMGILSWFAFQFLNPEKDPVK